MKLGSFLARIGVVVLMLTSACQTASTPAATITQTSQPTPTAEATSTPKPSSPPAPTAAEPTRAPEPTPTASQGGNADVLYVRAVQSESGTWTFHVTVEHPDTGWEDYADGWDVLTLDGQVLKPDANSPFTRLLLHPHETEQPFTRSQSGIVISNGATKVRVRAHDLVDGYGGREVTVDLTQSSGPDFEVER